MSIDIDFEKIIIGVCTFVITFVINRSVKRMDKINEKLEQMSVDLAELRGSITGRFVINDVKSIKEFKK